MRYLAYLLVLCVMQLLAWIITPAIALLWECRMGWCDNRSYQEEGPRLKRWLAWFDTPDNSLMGDANWRASGHDGAHWIDRCRWLYRNSLYGFKWTVLSAPMNKDVREIHGESPTWSTPGFQRIRMGRYWQWHLVKQIGPLLINLNLGWLLNDGDQPRALFMFSPRVRYV